MHVALLWMRRCRLTLALAAILIAGAAVSQSFHGPISDEWCHRWGCSPELFRQGQWYRMLTSLPFTAGGAKFYLSLFMLIGCVGVVEYRIGAVRTLLAFLGFHLITLLTLCTAITLASGMGIAWAKTLENAPDVGPSAGYYGCLGLVTALVDTKLRRFILLGVLLALGIRVGWSGMHLPQAAQTLSADLAHLVAFPIGFITGKTLFDKKPRAGTTT